MKKYILVLLSIVCILSLTACGKEDTHEVEILIPAGSTEEFVYSDEEIRPTGNKITISSGAGLGDTEVILKPVNENVETGYVATYLTRGMPVEFDTANVNDEWFKIGVSVQNDSDQGPIAVSVEVEGVEVRIADEAGANLSLNNIIILSQKGHELTWSDFEQYNYIETGSGLYIRVYEINEMFSLWIGGAGPDSEPMYIYLQLADDRDVKIDIRDGGVTEFISEHNVTSNEAETIIYNGKEYKKSELCDATLHWLGLSEEERITSSYMPPEFMEITETWGVSVTAKDITVTGMNLVCTQSGGEPTGELQTGSWFILENWSKEKGWSEVNNLSQNLEVGWTDEAYMIPMDDTVEWEVNWEWLYGELPAGKYRFGKQIMDFRKSGDYDTAIYFAEFEIAE